MQSTTCKPSEAGLSKCWVIFTNGAKKTFRSYDRSGRYEVADPRSYGIRGLKKMVHRYGDAVARAILYDVETGHAIEQYTQGQWTAANNY